MTDIQVVIFNLNDELCSVDTSIVYKIEKYGEVSLVPQMPDYIKGLYNLRGKVVPIVDLNKRFNMGDSEITAKTKIIITEDDNQLFGFIVDNVMEIVTLNEKAIEKSEAVLRVNKNRYIKGIGKKDNKLFSIIDLNEILNTQEVQEVKEVISNKE
ncbi:purine-binding chemotaxis protein CheW [Ruminiclostridium sufflavum DSM 19573]|uniref:Purine-binding chemotaxis protein CheW n=1 Tax=Ruminiclostridium sufflavum DSM 19573 TaxID=1121337 RepID=A0A318XNP9_9FIRM|nr:chemotaxis protein CheW [Ruminiclostridium sufflavum]PYG88569.1 purine-binding chemotaxis protein CheW [Ruminiclostridium sufflavum DSM 19573]